MNAEEKLYGMMTVIEEQQKILSSSLVEFEKVTEELRKQKNELSKTVDDISSKVSKNVSKEVVLELGASQRAFNDEMTASGTRTLKTAQETAEALNRARATTAYLYGDIKGTLTKEVGKTVSILTFGFLAVSVGLILGFTWYYASKAVEQKDMYDYWSQKADVAYSKCMKLKSCANSVK